LASAQDAGAGADLLYAQEPDEVGNERRLVINAQTWDYAGEDLDYDYDAADDFVVPAGESWSLETVYIDSRLLERGGAYEIPVSMNLSIWTDSGGGGPLAPVVDDNGFTCTYSGLVAQVHRPFPNGGTPQENLTVLLTTPCALPPGTYWLVGSAVVDIDQALFMWAQTATVTGSFTYVRSPIDGWLQAGDPVNCGLGFEPSWECYFPNDGPDQTSPRDLAFKLYGQAAVDSEPDGGAGEVDAGSAEPDGGVIGEPDGGGVGFDGGVGEPDGGSIGEPDGGSVLPDGGAIFDGSVIGDAGDVVEDGSSGDGDVEDGSSGDGDVEDGSSGDGDVEDGSSGDGDDEDGSFGDGDDDGPGGRPGKGGGGGGCSLSAESEGQSGLGMLSLMALGSLVMRRRRRTRA
jgi:MYXO-CTERM domain-containing protein